MKSLRTLIAYPPLKGKFTLRMKEIHALYTDVNTFSSISLGNSFAYSYKTIA